MNQFLESALYYASLGWKIFPCAPCQKTPLSDANLKLTHGCRDASDNPELIKAWWDKWPSANIGLLCGPSSGVYVIDIDVKEGCYNGYESLKEFPDLPITVRQDTPRGGSHFLYQSSVPPANRNSFRPGIDIRCDGYYIVLPPSVHPNGGVYRWIDSLAPGVQALAEFPEFMRPSTRIPWKTSAEKCTAKTVQESPQASATIAQTTSDILIRASAYLATCDPAIQGDCGHNKLLWAAVVLTHGFLLTDNQAFDLLIREYNPRCIPPWDMSVPKDHRDFCRKINEARKITPQNPEGWLLNEYDSDNTACRIDCESLLANVSVISCSRKSSDDPSNPELEYQYLIRPTGLLGEICSWINATAIKEQPFLSVACALAFLGALFGRRVRDTLGSRTNLYCMGVAPSSAGKAHAMNQIRRLATASGSTSLLGGDDIASDSAIEDRVNREPATLFMWDEIGHLLAHIKSGISQHHAQVVSLLMKLYSAAGNIYLGKEYAERDRQRTIVQPCCCIYGTSTMERFTSGISPVELQDGWLSRCLVFQAPFDSLKRRGRTENAVPGTLTEQVNRWFARQITPDGKPILSTFVNPSGGQQAPQQLVVPTDRDAEEIFIQFDNEATEYGKKYPMLNCLWAKGEENARRIALICACSESFGNPIITSPIADYACRLIRYILLDFGMTIAPEIVVGRDDSDKRKILKRIEKSGTMGCTQREVTLASQWLRKRNRNELLDDLVEAGEIARKAANVGKAVTWRYWTASNYSEVVSE